MKPRVEIVRGIGIVAGPRRFREWRTIGAAAYQRIKRFGAQVVKTTFSSYDETEKYAMELAKKTGRVWISPYDDDHVQAGNGGDPGQPFLGRSLRILFINAERGPGCDGLKNDPCSIAV